MKRKALVRGLWGFPGGLQSSRELQLSYPLGLETARIIPAIPHLLPPLVMKSQPLSFRPFCPEYWAAYTERPL